MDTESSFKTSLLLSFIAVMFAMLERVVVFLMHLVLVFYKTSLLSRFMAAMLVRLFGSYINYLLVFCKWFLYDWVKVAMLNSVILVFLKMSYFSWFKLTHSCTIFWCFLRFPFWVVFSCNVCKGIWASFCCFASDSFAFASYTIC